jgi:hypothetical protein
VPMSSDRRSGGNSCVQRALPGQATSMIAAKATLAQTIQH